MVKVVIAGATGRMGHALIESVLNDADCVLHGAIDREGSPQLGRDVGEQFGRITQVQLTCDINTALKGADVLIDFTRPEASMRYLEHCRALNIKHVIGTTGFSDAQRTSIEEAAKEIAIVFAPNMSVGVNLLINLVEQAAKVLHEGYDIEVVEMHHRHKVDAPSGTALRLGEAAALGLGQQLKDCAVYAREGVTGERKTGTIGFATMRGGDVVGDHTVVLAGVGERIELTHKASSRATFAQGALRAAKFLSNHDDGLFDMRDVLGLR
ncbi:MAG: 4-hydroxy-tetrahydrodipicolinate reductase [Methylophilaceae bacterium 17-44-8]|jgi:4-hydroxy-tetrahydrodipicolinate reductase|nr:MAG: 4-hydroxy-tetrahydrodipicolinate reductase [Methylophilales bacterium 28-44-11]OYZ04145.1 MAG: 4-hydroxy-tetrahydrodipicolinate reductase [Methylophilales bacterium 16-45-7]OZA04768.1 MAG: 4-hydroxy-tetrahydrodipicolinate reductase [Methylophilaceae bacterium 17-44-8]